MIRKTSALAALCCIGLLLSECKTSSKSAGANASKPSDKTATPPVKPLTPEEISAGIADGKAVFELKCHECHKQPIVSKYSKDEWPGIMNKMARKAHLNDTEKRNVVAFVVSAAR